MKSKYLIGIARCKDGWKVYENGSGTYCMCHTLRNARMIKAALLNSIYFSRGNWFLDRYGFHSMEK